MTVTACLRIYLYAVVTAAVLYGVVGPLFDHHFSERIPYHGHLYLSGQSSSHVHVVEQLHVHDGSLTGGGDILFLPDPGSQTAFDGFTGWQSLMSAPLLMIMPILLMVLIGWGPPQRLRSAFVHPPHAPPRLWA